MKYVFLILHYQNMDVTMKCVESIFSFCSTDFSIVIVDNNSPNGSGEKLVKKFDNNPLVTVILTNENLGFAKGNNLGFSHIKKTMSPNYIVMMNSDTEILDKNFLREIDRINDEYFPAVIGPQIILSDGKIGTYPFAPVNKSHLKREIRRFRVKKALYQIGLGGLVRYLETRRIQYTDYDEWNEFHKDVVLNGCCLIFTSKYIEKFDGIFEKTFMYKEEQFLYHRLSRSNLMSVYAPSIKIKHLEGSSTEEMSKNKAVNFYRREIDSDKLLIDYLDDNQSL